MYLQSSIRTIATSCIYKKIILTYSCKHKKYVPKSQVHQNHKISNILIPKTPCSMYIRIWKDEKGGKQLTTIYSLTNELTK
jgi:hypothetical protein